MTDNDAMVLLKVGYVVFFVIPVLGAIALFTGLIETSSDSYGPDICQDQRGTYTC